MRNLRLLSVLITALTLTLALAAGSSARAASPSASKLERPTPSQPAKSQPAPAALATSPSATQRTFVSGLGSDANPCSRTAPCRNFTKAISETLANGEVIVLDSAGYGPFTVDKSIDIIAPAGVYAGVTTFSGDGITVNAPGATVVLRGLTVNGLGGNHGVHLVDASKLYLQQMTLKRFVGGGGLFVNTTGSPRIFIEDTVAHDNYVGLWQYAGTSRMAVVDSRLEGNAYGLFVFYNGAKATVRETLVAGNDSTGVLASGTGAELALEHATVAENGGAGIHSQDSAIVRISETMVTRNVTGLSLVGGQIVSWGNNRVAGNTANGAPTSTIPQV